MSRRVSCLVALMLLAGGRAAAQYRPPPPTEAQQRLAVALIAMAVSDRAKAVSDEQLGILLNARIEDADGAPAGRGSLENLTPEEVERRVHQMLTANPALLDELTALLARGQAGAAEPRPALPGATPEAGRHAARRWSRR